MTEKETEIGTAEEYRFKKTPWKENFIPPTVKNNKGFKVYKPMPRQAGRAGKRG